MSADGVNTSDLLCPEKETDLTIGDIRANEGLYERFISNVTGVTFYIPMLSARESKGLVTDDFKSQAQEGVYRAYIVIEAKDKQSPPSNIDPLVTRNPEYQFLIRRDNRTGRGLKGRGLVHLIHTRFWHDGVKVPYSKRQAKSNFESYEFDRNNPWTKELADDTYTDIENIFSVSIVPNSFRDDKESVPNYTTNSQKVVRSRRLYSEMSASYGFSGVSSCSLQFYAGWTPF
jgi:hypothetical protein